jgi:Ca-activated chloride channel family protein
MSLLLLAVPVILVFFSIYVLARRRFQYSEGYTSTMRSISSLTSNRSDLILGMTLVVASVSLVLALMRPQLHIDRLEPLYEKQDLILILDRSVSMQARDVPPSRFSRAINEIRSFLNNKPQSIDRVGLVGFAGTALVLSHLTRDFETLYFFLDWIAEDQNIYYGTNVSGALDTALEIARNDSTPSPKTFLLLSDGDDESTELIEFLNQLNDEGIRVHTIGIGTNQSVPIPMANEEGEGFLQDEEGNQLTTLFDESTLRQVASMTNGSFFRSETGHDLANALNNVIQKEQTQVGWERSVDFMDLYVPLLVVSSFATLVLIVKA